MNYSRLPLTTYQLGLPLGLTLWYRRSSFISFQHLKWKQRFGYKTKVNSTKNPLLIKETQLVVLAQGYSWKLLYKCNFKLFVHWLDFILIYTSTTIGHKVLNELPQGFVHIENEKRALLLCFAQPRSTVLFENIFPFYRLQLKNIAK